MKVGVLDLQGSVVEHVKILEKIDNIEPIRVKYKEDLDNIQGIILPGGESTTLGKLLKDFHIYDTLKEKIEKGLPVWGTCAGMILLAKDIEGQEESYFKAIDIKVKRNAYGSQLNSFFIEEMLEDIDREPIELVFIRAPYITTVGSNVTILKKVNGNIVAAKEKNVLVTSFHPELTEDTRFHKYFIDKFIRNK
ncbi:pyridoxal 5'-phosphate synthase glutaminase subunit PdxT [Clostridium sporogenes]|uniref:pyridoxal 5'-phosphate synthase glutaminase subunit PdxT n=1 Tax=Clostridium sporogenes TaxID=1509 RepID=UPI0013D74536|nr:pyridoxal 5'-phosphate synthase glutaminase subunit PdxT [Clostridium sporogenes]MBA4507719.1 pyridoxal 5'-phosphate synthase glutaminase subunit PdxT [Clostridium sporogenes]MCW6087812.1 pyridoxal 5'-phosphate synthase glutaminase subunit PdxT [Clostridium sporogenes]MCW6108480.1 pyridoxal 5'-phosphate synthase glutaminase subunit PdxT [Clostridium sporogenes]MDU4599451.1 pyridoxal 5'-phosphate synthase glutaminase subunit PdxT [Clostridium sporogenes]MDU6334930.1 pyridoxal 5'-phosphate sy